MVWSDWDHPVCLSDIADGGPGAWGRRVMSKVTVEKVPQVHGKSLQLMCELIDVASEEGTCRWEKLCTTQYMPGFDVLGTRDRGEVWKGPSTHSSWLCVNGLM